MKLCIVMLKLIPRDIFHIKSLQKFKIAIKYAKVESKYLKNSMYK